MTVLSGRSYTKATYFTKIWTYYFPIRIFHLWSAYYCYERKLQTASFFSALLSELKPDLAVVSFRFSSYVSIFLCVFWPVQDQPPSFQFCKSHLVSGSGSQLRPTEFPPSSTSAIFSVCKRVVSVCSLMQQACSQWTIFLSCLDFSSPNSNGEHGLRCFNFL